MVRYSHALSIAARWENKLDRLLTTLQGLGGEDGAVSVDMEHFQYTQDAGSNNIIVGGGTRLGQIDEHLSTSQRAIPHGMCFGIGIGGHATVVSDSNRSSSPRRTLTNCVQGGIGPMSRMWGTTLDHVVEVEVVTANSTVVRASSEENSDLFFVSFSQHQCSMLQLLTYFYRL